MSKKAIDICVATHKKLTLSFPEPYRPIQVNCANTGEHWEGYLHDDEGSNISAKNPYYSELTALYWLWKNSRAEIKGLVHYRRFFSGRDQLNYADTCYCDADSLDQTILSGDEMAKCLTECGYDLLTIMPQRPYPKTALDDLLGNIYQSDLHALRIVIDSRYPDYSGALEDILNSQNLSYFNMMIADAEVFDNYCRWLFDVLENVSDLIDVSGYDTQHKRVFGYLAEILLNVYLEVNQLRCKSYLLLRTFQDAGIAAETREKIVRRTKQFDFLLKYRLGFVIDQYYRSFHRELYDQYVACQNYMRKRMN